MLEFEDSARSEAPPREVWKILYDPARITDWWKGWRPHRSATASSPSSTSTFPSCRSRTASRCATRGSAVVISCLLHDFVYDWRLEPLDEGQADPNHRSMSRFPTRR